MNLPAPLRRTRTLTVFTFLGVVVLALIPPILLLPSQVPEDAPAISAARGFLVSWLIGATAVALALSLWLSSKLARPIRDLTAAARDVAGRRHHSQLVDGGLSEVDDLSRAFEMMSEALQTGFAALESERDRLDAVLRHMADGILIVNADGLITLGNPAAARILGVDFEGMVGKRVAAVAREHEVVETFHRCLDGGPSAGDIAESIERASPRRYLRVVATRTSEGNLPQVLLVLQDLTEVRRLESVRRDFFANVSHELRTPIAAIKAMVETLDDGAIDDPPAARDFLMRIHREIDGLSQLVQELLQLARIESGQASLSFEPVAPLELVARTVDRLQSLAERAGVELRMEVPEDLALVRADRDRVAQVLNNVVHNAIKYTPTGGKITISARLEGRAVAIAIADTGMGIAEEDLPRLFERFYKADKARASGGTGLGLAIAKHLVQAHGGKIKAESPGPGQGATITFTLPVA